MAPAESNTRVRPGGRHDLARSTPLRLPARPWACWGQPRAQEIRHRNRIPWRERVLLPDKSLVRPCDLRATLMNGVDCGYAPEHPAGAGPGSPHGAHDSSHDCTVPCSTGVETGQSARAPHCCHNCSCCCLMWCRRVVRPQPALIVNVARRRQGCGYCPAEATQEHPKAAQPSSPSPPPRMESI